MTFGRTADAAGKSRVRVRFVEPRLVKSSYRAAHRTNDRSALEPTGAGEGAFNETPLPRDPIAGKP